MPQVASLNYRAAWWCRSPHVQTCWPNIARRVPPIPWNRERLELPDGDFLDLDWHRAGSDRLLVISHGLEGSSRRVYITGLARAAMRRGWDVLAWNFRGCSGEPNRLPRSYHSGATEDLEAVVGQAAVEGYRFLALAGFSLGGNMTLKYLGENHPFQNRIAGAAVFSVPCHLRSAVIQMASPECAFYMRRFLREMGPKMEAKRNQFGPAFPWSDWRSMRTFREFDDTFTAPLHGFRDAEDYWERCSSLRFLEHIRVPTLILNAVDDPFLSQECYPREAVLRNPHLILEIPSQGGHVGFIGGGEFPGEYWSEYRALKFLDGLKESWGS